MTSGDGGLLPPGLPVGVLVKDAEGFRVALLADPAATEDVRIVDFKDPVEQPPIPSPDDLPAAVSPPAKKTGVTGSVVPAARPMLPDHLLTGTQPAPDLVAAARAALRHPLPPRPPQPEDQR